RDGVNPPITTPEITGYWPRTTRRVRDPTKYAQHILDLVNFIPDCRVELVEHAINGGVARGKGAEWPQSCQTANVVKNLILSEHPTFAPSPGMSATCEAGGPHFVETLDARCSVGLAFLEPAGQHRRGGYAGSHGVCGVHRGDDGLFVVHR